MKSKKRRALVITLGVILALVLVCTIGFQVFFRLPQPSYSGTLQIEGLKAPVEVRTDEHGIPHIFAQSNEDLFFAQGYITARERMFQMDLTRLAGRGELSTLFGDRMIATDKYFKTLGFYPAAEAEYTNIGPATRTAVDSYTSGVNAYLNTVKYLPAEYTILGGKPQAWKPADSMVAGLLMSFRLNSPRGIKPVLYQIYKQAGPDMLKKLLPYIPQGAPYISSTGENIPAFAQDTLPDIDELSSSADTFTQIDCPVPMRMRASNWMIFSGSRTTTGKPVFTGSPDLEAAIPSLFYLVHLKGGDYDVIGGSIAGLPGVHALGFNGRFAWSITVGNGDNLDYFTETLNPANPDQYLTEDGYKDFQVIDETIKVKGKADEKFKVKVSRHGPIVSEIMSELPPNCTMLWPGLMGRDGTVEGLLGLNRARNFDEFRATLGLVRGGSVHLGYADVDGNIGYQYITTLPIRKSGGNPIPVPGEKGQYDWTGFVPFEDHPYELNPARGYLGSFNQMPEPEPANFYGTAYFLFERPFRFEEMAKAKDKFTVDDIRQMQNDVGSNVAKRWVPRVLSVCGSNQELARYTGLLKDWDYTMAVDSPQATLFNSFFTHLIKNTLYDQLGMKIVDELFMDLHVSIPTQWLIRNMDDNNNELWDDISTTTVKETRDDIVLKSMKDAVAELSARLGSDPQNWAWGKVHQMTIKHPLGSVLPFLNLSPLPYAGDDFTIHAGWWTREHPYDMYSGAAIRIVVDMADLATMTIMSPPGQSGQYLSPYYSDLAETWSKGGQVPAHYTDAKQLKQVLTLEPGQTK